MHIRPVRQYLYHGATLAAMALVLPWVTAANAVSDCIDGKKIRTAIKDSTLGFGNGVMAMLSLVTDMSYMDVGERIEL